MIIPIILAALVAFYNIIALAALEEPLNKEAAAYAPPAAAAAAAAAVENQSKIVVFYNLYVGTREDVSRVRNIVIEQLSYLRPEYHGEVFVNSIGFPMPPIPDTTLIAHHESGDEHLTLHSLWKYCGANPHNSVAYLHSKGSFHPSTVNDQLRKFLTRATLSQECASRIRSKNDSTCNVCSSRFSPAPHPHNSGNMWLAHCGYVQNLIDPIQFVDRMKTVQWSTNSTHGVRKIRVDKLKESSCLGNGRYSAEHWIHSHPSVKPCDVHPDLAFLAGYKAVPKNADQIEWDLKLGPRYNMTTFNHFYLKSDAYCAGWGTNLEDRLLEYDQLYSEAPSSDWWGWSFFIKEWQENRVH